MKFIYSSLSKEILIINFGFWGKFLSWLCGCCIIFLTSDVTLDFYQCKLTEIYETLPFLLTTYSPLFTCMRQYPPFLTSNKHKKKDNSMFVFFSNKNFFFKFKTMFFLFYLHVLLCTMLLV